VETLRTRDSVNWNELRLVNYFVCPECEISFPVDDWNKETSFQNRCKNDKGLLMGTPYAPLPEGAITGWDHYCPECKQKFEGSELIIDEWD
jgi:hypothetical protein